MRRRRRGGERKGGVGREKIRENINTHENITDSQVKLQQQNAHIKISEIFDFT